MRDFTSVIDLEGNLCVRSSGYAENMTLDGVIMNRDQLYMVAPGEPGMLGTLNITGRETVVEGEPVITYDKYQEIKHELLSHADYDDDDAISTWHSRADHDMWDEFLARYEVKVITTAWTSTNMKCLWDISARMQASPDPDIVLARSVGRAAFDSVQGMLCTQPIALTIARNIMHEAGYTEVHDVSPWYMEPNTYQIKIDRQKKATLWCPRAADVVLDDRPWFSYGTIDELVTMKATVIADVTKKLRVLTRGDERAVNYKTINDIIAEIESALKVLPSQHQVYVRGREAQRIGRKKLLVLIDGIRDELAAL